jgi:hypothetical protein
MTRRTLVASGGAVAVALLLVSGIPGPADAGSGHGHGGGYGGRVGGNFATHFSARPFTAAPRFAGTSRFVGGNYGNYGHVHRGHIHRHRRIFIGAPFAYYPYYYYDYGEGCSWLRRRAVATGSGYWWNRYEACLAGDYDY